MQTAAVRARVFGGSKGEPVTQGDIDEVIRLSNELADLEMALAALAESILLRMGEEPTVRIGVHKVEVARALDGRTRTTAIRVDGAERWRRTMK